MNDTFIRLLFYSSFFLNEMRSIKSSHVQSNHHRNNHASFQHPVNTSYSSNDFTNQFFNNSLSANIINLIPSDFDAETIRVHACNKIPGLTRDQRKICQLYKDHIPFVGRGTKAGIDECQSQFKNSRWNCSSTDNSFHHILKTGMFPCVILRSISCQFSLEVSSFTFRSRFS
jgi:hypothetical protein